MFLLTMIIISISGANTIIEHLIHIVEGKGFLIKRPNSLYSRCIVGRRNQPVSVFVARRKWHSSVVVGEYIRLLPPVLLRYRLLGDGEASFAFLHLVVPVAVVVVVERDANPILVVGHQARYGRKTTWAVMS